MAETEENSSTTTTTTTTTLSLFSLPNLKPHHQQYHSANLLTSPLHTSASVPFKWEEQPGKPLPCLALALPSTNNSSNKCLDLPPRLLFETKFAKTPSPTTVLEGPYNIPKSYSFRFLRKRQGSFDGSLSGESSPERGLLGPIVLSRSSSCRSRRYSKGLFGSWRKRGYKQKSKSDVNGGNFVFPSSSSDDGTGTCTDNTTTSSDAGGGGGGGGAPVKVRKASFLDFSPVKSHFWATIYGAFKQMIPSPRKSTKWKKDAW